jgi:hypothetical protein
LTFRPFAIFAYYFFWTRGFTAGYRGFLIAAINTTFDFWAHAKLWELEKLVPNKREGSDLPASPK